MWQKTLSAICKLISNSTNISYDEISEILLSSMEILGGKKRVPKYGNLCEFIIDTGIADSIPNITENGVNCYYWMEFSQLDIENTPNGSQIEMLRGNNPSDSDRYKLENIGKVLSQFDSTAFIESKKKHVWLQDKNLLGIIAHDEDGYTSIQIHTRYSFICKYNTEHLEIIQWLNELQENRLY